MKIEAVVTEVRENGYAVIQAKRRSACAECHKGSCGACDLFLGDDKISALAKNSIGAQKGDTVTAESPSKHIIINAITVFILPLLCGFIGYCISHFAFNASESISALCAIAGVVLCFLCIFIYTKLSKGIGQTITITEIVKRNEEKM